MLEPVAVSLELVIGSDNPEPLSDRLRVPRLNPNGNEYEAQVIFTNFIERLTC